MNQDLEKIKDILSERKGKENAISSKQISKEMGYPMEDTQSVSRKAIHATAEKYNLPLLSCNRGFYIAETEQELDEYNKNIDSRINEMNRRRNLVNDNFKKEHKHQ